MPFLDDIRRLFREQIGKNSGIKNISVLAKLTGLQYVQVDRIKNIQESQRTAIIALGKIIDTLGGRLVFDEKESYEISMLKNFIAEQSKFLHESIEENVALKKEIERLKQVINDRA